MERALTTFHCGIGFQPMRWDCGRPARIGGRSGPDARAPLQCGPDARSPLNCAPRSAARAFTLIELLVAIAVVMVFVVLGVQVATDTLRSSEQVNAQLKLNLQSRLTMDWITRDIQTAIVRKDGGEWVRMEPSTLNAGISLPVCKLMLFSQAGELHPSGNLTLSGPAAVAYETAYCDPITLAATRQQTALFRLALDPAYTFQKGFVEATPLNLQTDLWNVLPSGTAVVTPANILIENIAGFQVAFEFLSSDGILHRSDATETFSAGVDGNVRTGSGGSAMTFPAARVISAEVTLWLLDPAGVRALKQASMPPNDFFARYARPFVRKIAIQTP